MGAGLPAPSKSSTIMNSWHRFFLVPFQTIVLLLIAALGWLIYSAPHWQAPTTINVRVPFGATTTLGRDTLAAAQADAAHLSLRHATDGSWWVGNLSVFKSLFIVQGGHEENPRHLPVTAGMHLDIGGKSFDVLDIGGHQLALKDDAGQRWDYDGFFLARNGVALASCPDLPFRQGAFETWNRLAPHWLDATRPLQLGGLVHCGNRLGLAGLPPGAAQLTQDSSGYVLSGISIDISYRPANENGTELKLARRELRLEDGARLTVGRTRFDIAMSGDTVTFTPIYRVRRYAEIMPPTHVDVVWKWATFDPWQLPASGLIWISLPLLVIAALFVAALNGRTPFDRRMSTHTAIVCAGGLILAALGLAEIGLGSRLGIAWTMSVYALAVLVWLVVPMRGHRGAWLSTLWLILLTIGIYSLLELGLGAQESHWLRHVQRSAAIATCGLGLGLALRLAIRQRILSWPSPSVIDMFLAGIAALACFALLVQWVAGNETGVAGFQPVEFAKLALVLLGAHALASRSEWVGSGCPSWIRFLMPVALACAIVVFALTLVHDYSPIVLFTFWVIGMALAWGGAHRNYRVLVGTTLLIVAGIACWIWVRQTAPTELMSDGFYDDRFGVWLAPELHPHTGQQFHQGALAIHQGGWLGAAAPGTANGAIMAVPAVESDFAPAFLLNRHGLVGGMALAAIQAWLILALVLAAVSALKAENSGDYRRAWALRWGGFAVCGGSALFLGHFIVSWCTNLGALPVMGQPMPLLSAGGSHLLFFAFPLLIGSVILAEESCNETP